MFHFPADLLTAMKAAISINACIAGTVKDAVSNYIELVIQSETNAL